MEGGKALEVISFAISAEKSLIEQYRVLAKDAPSEEDRKIAKKIEKFEQAHIKKLQKQYRNIEKRANFWS